MERELKGVRIPVLIDHDPERPASVLVREPPVFGPVDYPMSYETYGCGGRMILTGHYTFNGRTSRESGGLSHELMPADESVVDDDRESAGPEEEGLAIDQNPLGWWSASLTVRSDIVSWDLIRRRAPELVLTGANDESRTLWLLTPDTDTAGVRTGVTRSGCVVYEGPRVRTRAQARAGVRRLAAWFTSFEPRLLGGIRHSEGIAEQ